MRAIRHALHFKYILNHKWQKHVICSVRVLISCYLRADWESDRNCQKDNLSFLPQTASGGNKMFRTGDFSVLELSLTASQSDLALIARSPLCPLFSFRHSYPLVRRRTGQRLRVSERERERCNTCLHLPETFRLINETIDSMINTCAASY